MGILDRAQLLMGNKGMKNIADAKVIVFGVGGVGSWCIEGLVRSGIRNITIVDCDCVSESNVNRQLMATTKTIGEVKVEAMKRHLLEINPKAEVNAVNAVYSEEHNADFHLEQYDYIIDCIDSLKDKIHLLMNATQCPDATVFSSMGAALKMDPTQIKTAEFWKVRGCTLGAMMRKRMRRNHLTLAKHVMCVYSEEILENKGYEDMAEEIAYELETTSKAQINGSLVHITAIFGFTIAGLVIKDITSKP